jgi:tRNA dimethylallyltransferase
MKSRRGAPWLYKMLQRLDPKGADHLHCNDNQRIMRFLEVRILTGKSMLDHWQKKEPTSPKPLTLGLQVDRPILDKHILRQVQNRLTEGWIEETQTLIKAGLLENVLKIGPIGYAQVADLIAGKLKLDQALEQIYRATRRYAKRQMTWFRKASYIQWFPFQPESGYNINGITEVVKGNTWGKHS